MSPHIDDTTTAVAEATDGCAIRRAVAADASALAAFGARTFTDTYGQFNDPENLRLHIASTYALLQQADELADPGVITLLAYWRNEFTAFAQVRRSTPPPCVTGCAPVELHRLYVDKRWHGRGVSHRILAEARRAARSLEGETLWLKVWERNARAIAFYRKSNFRDVGTADFFLGTDRQADRVLVADLTR